LVNVLEQAEKSRLMRQSEGKDTILGNLVTTYSKMLFGK
jgi:hypothetical protein